ncbi:MAG TPA: hypothetical protein VEP91_01990 [Solirubrobacterales bacterium]|nr:hypothetical protein [Solirubrobacterales bacterium]
MTAAEKQKAKDMGVPSFFKGKRFRSIREEHLFAALDGAVAAMKGLSSPDPYNGRILGAMAVQLVMNDPRALGDISKRKILSFSQSSEEDRAQFFELLGFEISERYLQARKEEIPEETLFMSSESLVEKLGDIFEEMTELGKQMGNVVVMADEISLIVENDMPDAVNIAQGIVEGVVGSFESLVPSVDASGEIPNPVQRRAVAKAAFLRLGVEDLVQLAAERDITNLPNKAALAKALAEAYQDDLDEVARLTVREAEGEAAFGLVSRLLPLSKAPDLAAAKKGFESLRGHYVEVKPAVFFVYRDVSLSPDGAFLTITGAMRSFHVAPVEVMGTVQLNPKPRKDDITIKLQNDEKWAVVTARRASDLASIGAVLRRSGEVSTAGAVAAPDPLADAPFNTWDPRSLWILELFRRNFQADALTLQDTLMANFDSPKGSDLADEEGEGEGIPPRLASVKLKGQRLHDHPEVCSRLVQRSHLKDVEFRLRKVTDQEKNFSTLTRVRLAWERDHLAVMTGDSGATYDPDLHQLLVRLVRAAAERPLSTELIPILKNVQARSKETDVKAGAKGVLDNGSAVPPEPEDGQITVTAAGETAS